MKLQISSGVRIFSHMLNFGHFDFLCLNCSQIQNIDENLKNISGYYSPDVDVPWDMLFIILSQKMSSQKAKISSS